MNKPEKIHQPKRWIFLNPHNPAVRFLSKFFWLPSIVLVLLVIILGVGAYEIFQTTSDGGNGSGIHVFTDQENAQITTALHSDEQTPYPCINNTQDTCYNDPAVSYYPSGFSSNNLLRTYVPDSPNTLKQIYGRLVNISSDQATLQTSSHRIFTIHFPANTLQTYANTGYTYDLHNTSNSMLVTYRQLPSDGSTNLQPNQILGATVGTYHAQPPSIY